MLNAVRSDTSPKRQRGDGWTQAQAPARGPSRRSRSGLVSHGPALSISTQSLPVAEVARLPLVGAEVWRLPLRTTGGDGDLLFREVSDASAYPFCLPFLSRGFELSFDKAVTIIVGENGAGKSTLLEGIAAQLSR